MVDWKEFESACGRRDEFEWVRYLVQKSNEIEMFGDVLVRVFSMSAEWDRRTKDGRQRISLFNGILSRLWESEFAGYVHRIDMHRIGFEQDALMFGSTRSFDEGQE